MSIDYDSYRHKLIHTPQRQWDVDPTTTVLKTFSEETPTFSIVMPIYNQNSIIQSVLSSIVLTTVGTYEMILILDGCTDGSKERVLEWVEMIHFPSTCVRVHILENPIGIFETSCDNLGFNLSRGKYIIEIQADMKILTFGYNLLLTTPMEVYPDLFAVSGRCCHALNGLTQTQSVGKLGTLVEKPHPATFETNAVYLSHTANRGPLALRVSMLEEMGYLDEEHYVLGDDDHDLFTRAWVEKKWRTAFVPVEVYSPLDWGSTRKPMDPNVSSYLMKRKAKEINGYYRQNSARVLYPKGETRYMNVSEQLNARAQLLETKFSSK